MKQYVEQNTDAADVLEIRNFELPNWIYPASGFHAAKGSLSPQEEDWQNAAYARYYGIRGIKLEQEADNEE